MADGHGNDDKRIIVDFPAISFWLKELTEMYARRFDHLEQELAKANEKLDQILKRLTPSKPDGFVVTVRTKEKDTMAAKKLDILGADKGKRGTAGVDVQILPNGTALFTAKPVVTDPATGQPAVDANGNYIDPATGGPVVMPAGTPPLTWLASDPDLTMSADPNDTSGFALTQIGTAGTSTVADIVVTCETTLPGAASPISGQAPPVDIGPAPVTPSNPTGFAVSIS
jgi:hypothetical protein